MLKSNYVRIFAILPLLFLSSISCKSVAPTAEKSESIFPPLGMEYLENIGDSIITTVVAHRIPGKIASDSISFRKRDSPFMAKNTYSIPPQPFMMLRRKGNKIEYEFTGTIFKDNEPTDYGAVLSLKGGDTNLKIIPGNGPSIGGPGKEDLDQIVWRDTSLVVFNESNFRQELIYAGRDGDNVKFIYREFSGKLIRPAFTQNVEYDLSLGNVVGFKEARFEVVSADNVSIRYVTLSGF